MGYWDKKEERIKKSTCDCGKPVVLIKENGFAFDGYDQCYECYLEDVKIK